ncbi:MAG: hypothetical protein JRG76_15890, partial [Deltaproteobacteria bacterium]|nr:hypothetical protein [Deltaproteobacteria bacterium]
MTEPDAPADLASAAGVLARLHATSDQRPRPLRSLASLPAMSKWVTEAHTILPKQPAAAKAAEWLMDNGYLVERALRQIREDLPAGYYARLPALAIEDESRPPRVYALAHGLVHATRLQLTAESITRFVSAYQRVETLDLAELWALPTMLRLTCIEVLVSSLERIAPELAAPFEVARSETLPLRLDDTECVARSIRGLAMLNAISWPEFVEATSAIDAVLRHDPAGAYSKTDSQTRDRYRSSVEELARRSHHDEREVARRALAHARRATDASRARHVGFWLIAEGRERLEDSLRYRAGWLERGRRGLRRRATGVYLGTLVLLTASFVLVPASYLALVGADLAAWAGGLPLLLLPASMLALTVLHWTISRILPPSVLPKLALEGGIPSEFKTVVVIPSLLGSPGDVAHLLLQIERHYFSNPDPNLRFVLLTGFPEADEPRRPEDPALLEQAVRGIADLNRRMASGASGPFHLFHRERRFNPAEGHWMGWERKRGKLDEFNRLLRGDDDTTFEVHEGDPRGLEGVRFVITLDADTALPQGTAARLVGTLAHPLSRTEVDPATGRVRAGYTVVQPRVETSPESGNRSLFTRLYCGDTSVDIYSRAVSDVYQDLFGTGIYVGKAIYDVASFSQSLAGRVPENALASHDLFEGIHGRAALATDIVLYEDYPPTYLAFARRLHRWVRGDWQLVPWLRGRVPGARSDYLPNRFAWIDRWKIIDNLRRSLLPIALLLLIVSGWTWLPGNPLVWTLFAILAPAGHLFIDFSTGLVRERWPLSPDLSRNLSHDAGRWLLLLVFLPHQAAVTTDAIVRTLVRVLVTKRHLLEWTTAAHAAASIARRNPVALSWKEMAIAPLAALATGAALLYWRPGALAVAAPLLALWAVSPEIARRISRPAPDRREQLGVEDVALLRGIARRTWLFFESFVGPDGHWLPPDNYQEDPGRAVAHRTSPTNIGMLLLSTVAAYDLGYLGLEQLALRLRNTLRTVARLEHYRGHLLNWYHTRTLEPLPPRYVSTVDSGNLAAALLAIEAGCSELSGAPCLRAERWQGLADTITLLRENLSALFEEDDASPTAELEKRVVTMHALALEVRDTPDGWARTLHSIEASCAELDGILIDSVTSRRLSVDLNALREVRLWLARVHDHVRGMRREVESLAPWLDVLEATPSLSGRHPLADELAQTRTELGALLAPSAALGMVALRCEEASAALADARRRLDSVDAADDASLEVAEWLDELEKAIAVGAGPRNGLRPGLRPPGPAPVHRVQRHGQRDGLPSLRPARVRGAAREPRRHREGRRPRRALVLARSPVDPDGGRGRPALLGRHDVRVPDASPPRAQPAGHAAGREPASGGAGADGGRRASGPALGGVRVRVRGLRRGPQLPVPRVRRAGPRAQARTRRGSRRRSLRHRPGSPTVSVVGGPEPEAPSRPGNARKLWLLRGDRLHSEPTPGGSGARDRPLPHVPPPGNDPRRDRQPAVRRRAGEALRGEHSRAGRESPAAGASARAAPDRGAAEFGAPGRAAPLRAAGRAASVAPGPVRCAAERPPAGQRPTRFPGDGRRQWRTQLARPRDHARRPRWNPRRHRALDLRAGPGDGGHLERGAPADGRRRRRRRVPRPHGGTAPSPARGLHPDRHRGRRRRRHRGSADHRRERD